MRDAHGGNRPTTPVETAGTDQSPGFPASEWLSLHEYGIIGNQRTAALVSRHGSIDWACFPRFDSPSAFARILDRKRGGVHRVGPLESYTSHQQYVAGTNILATFFEVGRRRVLTVTDFMPVGPHVGTCDGDSRIVRRLEARGGPIEGGVWADPRFDYGRESPSWTVHSLRAEASAPSGRMTFTSPWPWTLANGVPISRGTVHPGSPAFVQLRWGGGMPEEVTPAQQLFGTDTYWRNWIAPADSPLRRVAARWHPWVERSELVLKLLSPADSGVFVAAPTTSLPEWAGGGRNWDYRYVWIRDAAFTSQVFLLLGHLSEARAYVDWALERATELPPSADLRVVYQVDGRPPPEELELDHLEGHEGSRPIRIGNAAFGQRQHDIYGEVLDSALLLERVDPGFVRKHWATLEQLADRAAELWSTPDHGIWEIRGPPAHYVHSKVMCWVAMDRAIQLAEAFGETVPVDRWRGTAEEIRQAILSEGYDAQQGSFVQAFGQTRLDSAALRIPSIGFLPPGDPRVTSTIDALERTLDHGGFLRRYEGGDGIEGPEGAFLLCSFWHVEALARCGQMDRAMERWRSLLEAASPLLLFSEQFDPVRARPLGNYPQSFTHIGVLRAALALGLVAAHS